MGFHSGVPVCSNLELDEFKNCVIAFLGVNQYPICIVASMTKEKTMGTLRLNDMISFYRKNGG